MSLVTWKSVAAVVLAGIVAGCGRPTAPSARTTGEGSSTTAVASDILVSERPSDAKPVAEVRETATDGGAVTILGRIGGGANPWVDGRAAFTIVDLKLAPCHPSEGCKTPWDYCCSTDQLPKNRAMVKVVDGAGGTVEQDARKLLGLKELQTVVVKGTAKRDEAGNLTVLATGIFVVPDAN